MSYRPLASWLLGHPDAALADVGHAIEDAREFGQAATLLYALFWVSLPYFYCGNYPTAKALTDELVALADEKSALYWKTAAMFMHGCLLVQGGKALNAIEVLTTAQSALRSTGATLFAPAYLSYLARAYAELGNCDDARRCVAEAVTAAETTRETWFEAEIHRMAGEIALILPGPDAAEAEACFERALAVARAQQAKSWELRAAMSLTRLWRDQGKPRQARELLAPVYGWFTEGFDTRDLKEAKALLEELAS